MQPSGALQSLGVDPLHEPLNGRPLLQIEPPLDMNFFISGVTQSAGGAAGSGKNGPSGRLMPCLLSPACALRHSSMRRRSSLSHLSGTHLSRQTRRLASLRSVTLMVWMYLPPGPWVTCP